jgi:hypothetical protein
MLKDSSMEAKAGTAETGAAKGKETATQKNAADVAKASKAESTQQKAAGKEAVESKHPFPLGSESRRVFRANAPEDTDL